MTTYIIVFCGKFNKRLGHEQTGRIDEVNKSDVLWEIRDSLDEIVVNSVAIGEIDDPSIDVGAIGSDLLQTALCVCETFLAARDDDDGEAATSGGCCAGEADAGAAADDQGGGTRGIGRHFGDERWGLG